MKEAIFNYKYFVNSEENTLSNEFDNKDSQNKT